MRTRSSRRSARGGMGDVWRARDTRLGATSRSRSCRTRWHRPRRPRAVRPRGPGRRRALSPEHPRPSRRRLEGGVSWAVTELLEGQTLKARLDEGAAAVAARRGDRARAGGGSRGGACPRGRAPGRQAVERLPHVRRAGEDPRLRHRHAGRLDEPSRPPRATSPEPQAIVGDAGYLSPEQIRRERADARSDIFALGCVLYEMVTGRRTFPGETPPEALVATLRGEPRDPADLVTGLPPELRRLILRCLEKKPDRRFQTAADLGFALRIPFTGSGSVAPSSSPRRTRPRSSPRQRGPVRSRVASVAAGGALSRRRSRGCRRTPVLPQGPGRARGPAVHERDRRPGERVPLRRRDGFPDRRPLEDAGALGARAGDRLLEAAGTRSARGGPFPARRARSSWVGCGGRDAISM